MMRPSARTAHTSCSALLPPGKKYVSVHLLTLETFFFIVDVRSKGEELFDQVCNFLGLSDVEMFGLALLQDGEYHFIDPSLKLSKYASKTWKSQQGMGVDSSGKPLLSLHLRIQLYVDSHLLISDKVARHHYYLQLKDNVISYCLPVGEERAFMLAAYALQSDVGNYNPEKHVKNYFNPAKYFPAWIIQHVGENYITEHAPSMHRDNYGLSKGEAQVGYIKEASDPLAPHNMHFYKLKRKKAKLHSVIWLGICPRGIEIYEEKECITKHHLSTFAWSDIEKLYFEKKKFEIRSVGYPDTRKFVYFANSEETTKSLLWLCRIAHQFHMAVQPRLQELRKLELEGHKQYRESYIYSDSYDLALEQGHSNVEDRTSTIPISVSLPLKKSGTSSSSSDQRVSVISNASSNTTSGIVSDKVHSFDESEDEADEEIMITTPPAPSLESLPSSEDLGFPKTAEDREASSTSKEANKQKSLAGSHILSLGWSSIDQRSASWTPTASVVSGSSYTSFSDSTYSSSSQMSAATIKTTALGQKLVPPFEHSLGAVSENRTCVCRLFPTNKHCMACKDIGLVTREGQKINCISLETNGRRRESSMDSTKSVLSSQEKCLSCPKKLGKLDLDTLKCSEVPSREMTTMLCVPVPSVFNECIPGHNGNISGVRSHVTDVSSASVVTTTTERANSKHSFPVPNKTPNSHGRTATRIGVSSLTRTQRQPLALCNVSVGSIGIAASEPNLCNPKIWATPVVPPSLYYFSLPGKDGCASTLPNNHWNRIALSHSAVPPLVCQGTFTDQQVKHHSTSDLTLLPPNHSAGGSATEALQTVDFPCIPPPPEYSSNYSQPPGCAQAENEKETSKLEDMGPEINTDKECDGGTSLESEVTESDGGARKDSEYGKDDDTLDLQQLREKSRDLDLPLISALCNDRSLLMLPKTVPTCSRQRHLGSCRDVRRFSCSYVPSIAFGGGMSEMISPRVAASTENIPSCPQHRPLSWHLDWLTSASPQLHAEKPTPLRVQSSVSDMVPPKMLTSFGRTPEKCFTEGDVTVFGQSRSPLKQMIPMKLSSNSIINSVPASNGRT